MALDPNRVDLYTGALMSSVPYAQRLRRNNIVPAAVYGPPPVPPRNNIVPAAVFGPPAPEVPAPAPAMASAAPASPANPIQQQLDALSQYYGVPITLNSSGQILVPLAPGVQGSYRAYVPGNIGEALKAVGLDPATGQQAAAPAGPQSYAELVNPYGNAYMQRLQEQLAGRSEANLQRMNALMSQRGMGGTGLAAARALQAQSDVGQQLLGAQQEATQLGAQFDLSRLAGMTGQQQFARQQTAAEQQAGAARKLSRQQFGLTKQAQEAELLGKAASGLASSLGIAPKQQPTQTGGGVQIQQRAFIPGVQSRFLY